MCLHLDSVQKWMSLSLDRCYPSLLPFLACRVEKSLKRIKFLATQSTPYIIYLLYVSWVVAKSLSICYKPYVRVKNWTLSLSFPKASANGSFTNVYLMVTLSLPTLLLFLYVTGSLYLPILRMSLYVTESVSLPILKSVFVCYWKS